MTTTQEEDDVVHPLRSSAILVDLNVHAWGSRKLDRVVTDETNQRHKASASAGRFNKLLLDASAFVEVYGIARTARVLHHTLTQPWFDNGQRILSNILVEDFSARFRQLTADYNTAADRFCNEYKKNVEEAKNKHLGSMFRSTDYPPVQKVRKQFSMEIVFLPVSGGSDIRTSLPKELLEDIRANTEKHLQTALDNAMKEPVQRIIRVVGHMAERLKQYKAKDKSKLYASMISNIQELVDLLPMFNLTNDPVLTELTKSMQQDLCSYEIDVLREDDGIRKEVARSADAILKKAEALMA